MSKPLGGKSYGSIPHLPGSRLGPGDHHVSEGQARICTVKPRDRHDVIIVQEKLDGSNVAAARIDGQILALTRAGYLATTSQYEQHHMWAAWVRENADRFMAVLADGERLCGEWLAQAHGTRYELEAWNREPFAAFDIIRGSERLNFDDFLSAVHQGGFCLPFLLSHGAPYSVEDLLERLKMPTWSGAVDPIEGAVWRVERQGKVDFLAKWVRPDKVDGLYLPEMNGGQAIWNWRMWAEKAGAA